MMKAAVITEFNAPWEIRNVPIPKPKSGQVLIKIQASGICGTDLHVTSGLFPVVLPIIPGHEPVGEIVELGEGVTNLRLKDRVGVSWHQKGCGRCHYCQCKRELYCTGSPSGAVTWMQLGGSHAEYMIAYAEACTLIPQNLTAELAAPLLCAGFTISSGYQNAQASASDIITVIGVGGLGHLAIQLAKAKGHRVIAVTEHQDKAYLAKQLGADDVIVTSSEIGLKLKKLGGTDVILDTSNSNPMINDAIGGLKPEGRCVIMGLDTRPLEISNANLIHLQAKILGSTQNNRSDLIDILDLASQGKIKPMIEIFSLEECNKAIKKIHDQDIHFRAVLKMD